MSVGSVEGTPEAATASEGREAAAAAPGPAAVSTDEEAGPEARLVKDTSTSTPKDVLAKRPWFTNPYVCWRHPVARIAVVITIMGLDFYIYGEDPVNDSWVEYNFPALGHVYGLLFLWPHEASLTLIRVGCIIGSLIVGTYISRQWVHHWLIRDKMKLTMFEGNKGTLLIMLFGVFVALYGGALVYNAVIPKGAQPIESRTYAQMRNVGKVFQIWSVFLDITSIAQIVDAVLQDRNIYPDWAPGLKRFWIETWGGTFRVVFTWVSVVLAVVVSTAAILNTGPEGSVHWDNTTVGGLSEVGRTLFLNLIILCDLATVAQDWDFPSFQQPVDVMIAGTFNTEISCGCFSRCFGWLCGSGGRLPHVADFLHFRITGPWLTYGPLLLVMMADLGCAKTQFMYSPQTYGQYVEPGTGRIWNIIDEEYLLKAYKEGNLARPELVTWEARRDAEGEPLNPSAATDMELNSRHYDTPFEWLTILPGILTIAAFVYLVYSGEQAWKSHAMEIIGEVGEEVEREVELAAKMTLNVGHSVVSSLTKHQATKRLAEAPLLCPCSGEPTASGHSA